MRLAGLLLALGAALAACQRRPAPPPATGQPAGGDAAAVPAATTCGPAVLPPLGTAPVAGVAFDRPVFLAQAPGAPDTLWVVEQGGRIRLVRGGAVLPQPFLDLSARIGTLGGVGDERGLLGLAFHPRYPEDGRFFVAYTPAAERPRENVVAEYRRGPAADAADPVERARLVAIEDPEPNHNGGMLAFGPDGLLYAGTGDGGGAGDRHGAVGNAQDRHSLLGKLLRLDVDAPERGYAARGNPFAPPAGRPQVWAYGLRNPWRFAFDRATGDLYIADVGQNAYEEVNVTRAPSPGGENYGWRAYEGLHAFDRGLAAATTGAVTPVLEVRHGRVDQPLRGACSITGGYVYRGAALPALGGFYLFGDWCSEDVAAFRYCDGAAAALQRIPGLRGPNRGLASFGEDLAGELYLVYVNDGAVLRIVGR